MEQNIRFCSTGDGASVAYAAIGSGPPLVKAANWLSHLEFDWESPIWRHWWQDLGERYHLVRYDARGCGLSDWDVDNLSFEAWVRDLETVVDAMGLDRFPLLGLSQSGAVAIAYAVRHPERVSHLVLLSSAHTLAGSWRVIPQRSNRRRSKRSGDSSSSAGAPTTPRSVRHVFTRWFIPGGSAEQMSWFDELMRRSVSPQNAVRFFDVINEIDVRELATQVAVPTLVLHARDETRVPFEEGRMLASLIPDARLVPLSSANQRPLARRRARRAPDTARRPCLCSCRGSRAARPTCRPCGSRHR